MKSLISSLLFLLWLCVSLPVDCFREDVAGGMRPTMVEREHRKPLMMTEYGEISAVDIRSGRRESHHLEFMTLDPNSLFLPVLLHADMVSYVNTGSGKLSWSEDGKAMRRMNIKRGDVYRLHAGSVFFMQSNLENERQKLRIYSIFSNTEDEHIYVPSIGAYSSISDLVLGFDRRLLQSAFMVPEGVIEEMKSARRPKGIIHALPEKEKKSIFREIEARLLKFLTGNKDAPFYEINGGSKKAETFNILKADPDFENCNGWSVTVGRKELKSLRGSNIGVFMVNLTKGSMMGPHWNPMATEIAIVLHGEGMVRMVCASSGSETKCKNKRFRVKEGDVFVTPRFYPMAQMSFNNDSFVFMGFSTSTMKNYPQFLAGKKSVLQTLDKDILALSFNVTNSTIDALVTPQEEAIILDCTSCAEEEEIKMERERKEEDRKREEEEKRKREEEKKRREEEEEEAERERRERERKEAEKRQEEERRRREERARREQEEARRQEEERERRQREKEEEARKEREREEGGEGQPEEHKRREDEGRKEQEARKREKKEMKKDVKEEEVEKERRKKERKRAEKRQEEEHIRREERARREQEEARRQEEERQRRHREKEESRKEREPEEGSKGQQEEDEEGTTNEGKRRIIAIRKAWKIYKATP